MRRRYSTLMSILLALSLFSTWSASARPATAQSGALVTHVSGSVTLASPETALRLAIDDLPADAVVAGVSLKIAVEGIAEPSLTAQISAPRSDQPRSLALVAAPMRSKGTDTTRGTTGDKPPHGVLSTASTRHDLDGAAARGDWTIIIGLPDAGLNGRTATVGLAVWYKTISSTASTTPSNRRLETRSLPAPLARLLSTSSNRPVSKPAGSAGKVRSAALPDGWVPIMEEGFEAGFPGDGWTLFDLSNDGFERQWGSNDYIAASGSESAWPAAGGADGLEPNDYDYPDNLDSWMIYGPLDLSQVTDAQVEFKLWRDIEPTFDEFSFGVSDGSIFEGYGLSGVMPYWETFTMSLTDNIGSEKIWLFWRFTSDDSNPIPYEGPFVDDIVVSVPSGSGGGPPPIRSVSGRVTDQYGNPVAGTTISAGQSHSAMTDSNGDYLIAGLPTGSITLQPSMANHSFWPTTRQVSLPPSRVGQDFVAVDRGAGGPILIVVPGSVPADGASAATAVLFGAPAGHELRMYSEARSDAFDSSTGVVQADELFVSHVRSSNPGAAELRVDDLTTSEPLPVSARVIFTGAGVGLPPSSAPVDIAGVNWEHPLDTRYLQGIPVSNRIDVTVNWKGAQPGRVDFILNGIVHSEPAGGQVVAHVFDMGNDLKPGRNQLRIVAYNASGQASLARDWSPYSIGLPVWMAGLQIAGALAPMVLTGSWSAGEEYSAHVKVPLDGFGIRSDKIGPSGSKTGIDLSFGGGVSLPLSCAEPFEITADMSAELPSAKLTDIEVGGELKGSGSVKAYDLICEISSATGTFRVDIKVYGEKSWGVIPFAVNFIAPGAGEALDKVVPDQVADFLGEVYVQASLQGFLESSVTTIDEAPWLEWQGVRVGFGPGLETGYRMEGLKGFELKVYLGASGTIEMANPNPLRYPTNLTFDKATIRGEAGYVARLLWFEAEQKFYVEWTYPREGGQQAQPQLALTPQAEGEQQAEFRLIQRQPSGAQAHFEGAPPARQAFAELASVGTSARLTAQASMTSTLISNSYPYPEPVLSLHPTTGHALALYVCDNPAKPLGQSLEICFSRWNGAAWSAPGQVTNDDRLDGAPQVAWLPDGRAIAIWQRLNAPLAPTATWDTATAKKVEIATSTYDPTTNTWSTVTLLTSNQALDVAPQLAIDGQGQAIAVWRQNRAGLLAGNSVHPDQIMVATFNGAWSKPQIVGGQLPGLLDLDVAAGKHAVMIAYTLVEQASIGSTPASRLFTISGQTGAWSKPAQLTADRAPYAVPRVIYNTADQPLLVWSAGSELRLRNLTTRVESRLAIPSELGSLDDLRLVRDEAGNIAAVFTAQAAQRDLYIAFYDQAHSLWGAPAHLTDDQSSEARPAPALDQSGRLLMVYAVTTINPDARTAALPGSSQLITYTVPIEGQTDVVTLARTFGRNLAIPSDGVTIDDPHAMPGSSVVISATIANTADFVVDSPLVRFYDGDPRAGGSPIGQGVVNAPLAAGATTTVTATITVPLSERAHMLYAFVDPDNAIAEADEGDNIAGLAAFGPDLAITNGGIIPWSGEQVGVRLLVQNLGASFAPVSNLKVFHDQVNGTLAISRSLPALAAGQAMTLTLPLSIDSLPPGSHRLMAIVNQADFNETFKANNSFPLSVELRPDPAVNAAAVEATRIGSTLVLTATIANVGQIAAERVPVGFYGDDHTLLFTRTVDFLPAGGVAQVRGQIEGFTGCSAAVLIDPDYALAEASRANNMASVTIPGGSCDQPLDRSFCQIYAVHDRGAADSQFVTITPSDHHVTALGQLLAGYDIEGLDIQPNTNRMYATAGSGNIHGQDGYLYQIDPRSGTLTTIGGTGFSEVVGLSFRPNDSTLWGWAEDFGLVQIDTATGKGTQIFASRKPIEALAWNTTGTKLYGAAGSQLWVYDPATGALKRLVDSLPGVTEGLEMLPNGHLLGTIHERDHVVMFTYDLLQHKPVLRERLTTSYNDIESLGWPDTCGSLPELKSP